MRCGSGLGATARIGDQVTVGHAPAQTGEIVALAQDHAVIMPYGDPEGMFLGASVTIGQQAGIRPDEFWIGRIVDASGQPLDQRPLPQGPYRSRSGVSPAAAVRKTLGPRLRTGLAVFDTLLPIALGQRIGVFSGSGVGKSSLLADLACGLAADVVVLALIGERGRELRDFVENVLGPQGMARTVLVVATSDQSPLIKRRAAWVAMAVAEWFRDGGKHVLLIAEFPDALCRGASGGRPDRG